MSAEELIRKDRLRPVVSGFGKGRYWQYRDIKGHYIVVPTKEEAIKRANEALLAAEAGVSHEPVKGEQAGMLGVPGKYVEQKRPWTPGQIGIESYTKYKEAMGKPKTIIPEVTSVKKLIAERDSLEQFMREQRQKISDIEYRRLENQLSEMDLAIARFGLPQAAIPKPEAVTPEVTKATKFEDLSIAEKTRIHKEADKIAGAEIRQLSAYKILVEKDREWQKTHPGMATSPYYKGKGGMIDLYYEHFNPAVARILEKEKLLVVSTAIPKAEAKVEVEVMKRAEKPGKNLYWYSIAELKRMCQDKGLSTEGSKETLIRRLK